MAVVSDDDGPSRRYRAAQVGLGRLLLRDLRALRRIIVPSRLQPSIPQWIQAVNMLIGQYGQASAALAADYYDAQRVAAKATGTFTVPLVDPPPDRQVEESLRWATKDLWPRDPDDPSVTPAQRRPLEERLDAAEEKAEGAVQKLVLDMGRGTVREAVRRDRVAVGYARAAALNACPFCKLMATRGMVYKDVGAAGRDANERFEGNASVVKYHDNCHCQIIPVFRGQRFALSEQAAEWKRIYEEHAQGHSGDQLRRFRNALRDAGLLNTPT